jgi:hypothetical protein
MNTTTQQKRQVLPRITGEGMRQLVHGGPTVRAFWVASQSQPGMEHTVFLFADGRLSCDCPSSRYRGYCAHRDAVTRALAAEAVVIARASAKAAAEAECGWKLTTKGRAAMEAWRKEQEQEREQQAHATTRPSQRMRAPLPSGHSARNFQPVATSHPGDTAILRRDNRPFSLLK